MQRTESLKGNRKESALQGLSRIHARLSVQEVISLLQANSQFSKVAPSTVHRWFTRPTEATEKALLLLGCDVVDSATLASFQAQLELSEIYEEFENLRTRLRRFMRVYGRVP